MQHTYSCLYGTFLGNSPCERELHNIPKRTCSVWSLLRAGNKNFHNLLYMPSSEQVSAAPGPAFQALPCPGRPCPGLQGFPWGWALTWPCRRCCIPCAMCGPCTSGQPCTCRPPHRTLWDRRTWTSTCPPALRARTSVPGVWTGKSLELQAQAVAYAQIFCPSWSFLSFPCCSQLPCGSKSSVAVPQLLGEGVEVPAAPQRQEATLWCCAFQL